MHVPVLCGNSAVKKPFKTNTELTGRLWGQSPGQVAAAHARARALRQQSCHEATDAQLHLCTHRTSAQHSPQVRTHLVCSLQLLTPHLSYIIKLFSATPAPDKATVIKNRAALRPLQPQNISMHGLLSWNPHARDLWHAPLLLPFSEQAAFKTGAGAGAAGA